MIGRIIVSGIGFVNVFQMFAYFMTTTRYGEPAILTPAAWLTTWNILGVAGILLFDFTGWHLLWWWLPGSILVSRLSRYSQNPK
jgi:hypothetical protein